jgi:carboxypeptidase family protein
MRGAGVLRNLALVLLVGSPCASAAQTPAPSPAAAGLILGRVVDAAPGRPIAGAVVSLENVSLVMPGDAVAESRPRAMTNATGQFVFRRLEKGSFAITATKPVYADDVHGRRRPLIAVGDGEKKAQAIRIGGI